MKPLETKTIAQFCLSVREREEKSTREFADQVGIFFASISKAETGRVELPIEYLKKLKKFCSRNELEHLFELISASIRKELMAG